MPITNFTETRKGKKKNFKNRRSKWVEQYFKNKEGKWRYCDKIGHWEKDCRIRISDQARVKKSEFKPIIQEVNPGIEVNSMGVIAEGQVI